MNTTIPLRSLRFVLASLLVAASAAGAPSGWWNLSFRHSKWISVTAGSAAVPSGYTVPLTFDHAALVANSKSRADGSDVRVAYWNGSTWSELDRVLDPGSSWNSATTTIWFKLQAGISASSFDDNYGLYYANSGAGAPPASGSNVFLHFDGFESGDLSGWGSVWQDPGDTISATTTTVRSGTYAAQASIDAVNPGQASVRAEYAAQPGVHAVAYVHFPAGYAFNADTSVNQLYGGFWGEQQLTVNIQGTTRQVFLWNNVAAEPYFGTTIANTGQWYRLELKSIVSPTVGRAELWVDGVREVNESNRNTGSVNVDNNLVGIFWKNSGPNTLYVDDAFTRMWVDPEPSSGLGTENVCCSSLQVTTASGIVTVTAPNFFELRFSEATGGAVDQYFDLQEDPGKLYDLAGGIANSEGFPNAVLRVGGIWHGTTQNETAPDLHLLEATSTRVQIRQEARFEEEEGNAILAGIEGIGDFSIYPSGKMAWHWTQRATLAVTYTEADFNLSVFNDTVAPFNAWEPSSQTDDTFNNPPGDDFTLLKSNIPGNRTDFLNIMYRDWAIAEGHLRDATALFHLSNDTTQKRRHLEWREQTGATIPAGSTEEWNFLVYFKPNDLGNTASPWLDPAVTSRSTDFRSPDLLSAIGPGSGWNENTADTDFFNEDEAIYTLDLNPLSGLTFDMTGSAGTPRYSPAFKIRQWRSLSPPSTLTLEGVPLTRNIEYRSDVMPVSRASMQDLLWYSTLESAAAITSPDVGSAGSVVGGVTYEGARFGGGARVNASGDWIEVPTAGNFDAATGRIAFWYRPNYDSTDGVLHDICGFATDANNYWFLEKRADNNLYFRIRAGGGGIAELQVTSANYGWRPNEWVHLRFSWDDAAPLGTQQRLHINDIEPPHINPTVDYDSTLLSVAPSFRFGNSDGDATFAPGLYDEIEFVRSASAIANGGLLGSASEFLADPGAAKNFQLQFAGVDASKRGLYLFPGAATKFRGLNIALATKGAGVAPTALEWQYWNGTSWANLETVPGFTDETSSLTRDGTVYWTDDPPGWVPYSLSGGVEIYRIRIHLAAGASYTTFPTEGLIKTDVLLVQYCRDITAAAQTFSFAAPIPTAVELVDFAARGLDGAVELSWQTTSELDNLGFHLYRAAVEPVENGAIGPYQRITASAIPGLGSSPSGARYRYLDSSLENGRTYFYQLEDIETTGATERHGPVSATPMAGANPAAPPPSSGGLTYGTPESSSLRVIRRTSRELVLELATEGFEAELREDGSLSLSIPGFEPASEPGALAIPLRRAWIDAESGRGVRIASVRAEELQTFASLRPSAADLLDVAASPRGTVQPGRRGRREAPSFRGNGFFPEEAARVVRTGYQGDQRKALLELAPLRWDGRAGRLVLARRLRVHLSFSGREEPTHRESSHRRRGETAARLVARERGLYGVRFENVLTGRAVAASSLRLSRKGEPVAFHLEPDESDFGRGSTLYFWSDGAGSNPYGLEAVYELERATDGVSMPRVSASPSGSAVGVAWDRVEREENRYYQAALLEAPDLWLWDLLFAPVEKTYSFELAALATTGETSRLSLWLQGTSDFPASPDHHLRVRVNGALVAEASFEGKESFRLQAEIPAGVLREGGNVLSIENVGDTGAPYSMVMLDRFAVDYPRALRVSGGKLEVEFRESGEAEVHGLPRGAQVLDVTEPPARWLDGIRRVPGGVRLRVESGRRYAVLDPGAVAKPEVRKPLSSRLRSERNRADYLMVGPRELLAAAAPLLELRRAQGLASEAAPLEEIESEFGHGESSPEAVKEFLSFAYHHWRKPAPRYVLLLGDATYDFKDYLGTGVTNQLPPLMVKTSYLWTASDPAYAAVHGDDMLPDLAIGRLPAASAGELRVMVEKLLCHETSGSTDRGAVVLVADDADVAGDFERDLEEIASSVLASRSPRRIYLGRLGVDGTRRAIVEALDEGASLLSYAGHGGIHLWAHENVFTASSVSSLAPQPRQPLLLTWNCLNGYFHFPYFNSLSEELLKAEGKGAIAAFSPTGLSLNEPAQLFHKALLTELVSGRHARLGDAVLAAQAAYAATGAFPELLAIYHLLGDPALKLP